MWPSANVISGVLRGTCAEVFRSRDGSTIFGAKSCFPWVYLHGTIAVCDNCGTEQHLPAPPRSMSGPGEPPKFLFQFGDDAYSVYALTFLHEFARTHEHCEAK